MNNMSISVLNIKLAPACVCRQEHSSYTDHALQDTHQLSRSRIRGRRACTQKRLPHGNRAGETYHGIVRGNSIEPQLASKTPSPGILFFLAFDFSFSATCNLSLHWFSALVEVLCSTQSCQGISSTFEIKFKVNPPYHRTNQRILNLNRIAEDERLISQHKFTYRFKQII
jgi:hypothetical protein